MSNQTSQQYKRTISDDTRLLARSDEHRRGNNNKAQTRLRNTVVN